MERFNAYFDSPLGLLKIYSDNSFVYSIEFVREKEDDGESCVKPINECINQLKEYFEGKRENFNLKLFIAGTEFQKKVWRELQKIPYGKISTYKDIARNINAPKSCRAVGNACNKNKLAIIIPCHRVISSAGKLSGYAGSPEIKKRLLELEQPKNRSGKIY
ncbi:MAG TPA: methylated-DNA--[protein]-cysteine S-methyltransferase [Spirochaetota bacterium]|nr:methylated-DNA--[protein]-cysteine S-methyltransferase [Spirochaetota bacterium]